MVYSTAKENEFYAFAKELEDKEKSAKNFYDNYVYDPATDTYMVKTKQQKTLSFPYKGRKNKTDFPEFVNICKMSQKKLKQYLCGLMKNMYGEENTIIGDGYIYCRGDIPVLLTAHMDTVHKETVKDFYEDIQIDEQGNEKHIISSPQGIGGDDRCGIYAILKIIESGYYPYILFCEDEEVGGIGSNKFCKTKYITELSELKFLLELDRANSNDIIFYDNGNKDWKNWVEDETNWVIDYGSFSDICHLSPACEISSVNLSCGYYKAHTLYEYVVVEEMLEMIEMVKHLLNASESVIPFKYVEEKYKWGSYYGYGYYSRKFYDEDEEDEYYYNKVNNNTAFELEISFINEDGREEFAVVKGDSEQECWMNFFFDYADICFNNVLDFDLIPIY